MLLKIEQSLKSISKFIQHWLFWYTVLQGVANAVWCNYHQNQPPKFSCATHSTITFAHDPYPLATIISIFIPLPFLEQHKHGIM